MINREMKQCKLQPVAIKRDSFGQQVQKPTPQQDIEIAIYYKDEQKTSSPLYIEATHIGLTAHKHININDTIIAGEARYKVLKSNNSGRLAQLLLKEVS